MKRVPILAVALIVVAVAILATGMGIVWGNRGDTANAGMRPGMMNADSADAPGMRDDDSSGSMNGGPMMMGSFATASESEYLAEMVAHHEEAVAAALELTRSERPEMREFGESIVETQSAQIEEMSAWLAEWYPEQSPAADYEPMMRDLSNLSGDDLDRAFLDDMIGHHMAAVMMSQHLLRLPADHEEVTDLARTIRDDQHAEIVQMHRWLAQWFDADWDGMGMGMDH